MSANESIGPLARLEELYREAVEAAGGTLMHFSLCPSKREVQVLIDLGDELFMDDESKKMNEAFAEIEKNFLVEEREQQMESTTKEKLAELEQRLADPDEGIL